MCECVGGQDASVSASICVLASVVPVRHDRRRELKPVGIERPSHIPMWCVCVYVWLFVCREWPSLQTSVTDGCFWYQPFGFIEAYGQRILPSGREFKCDSVCAGLRSCVCVCMPTLLRTSSSLTKLPPRGLFSCFQSWNVKNVVWVILISPPLLTKWT